MGAGGSGGSNMQLPTSLYEKVFPSLSNWGNQFTDAGQSAPTFDQSYFQNLAQKNNWSPDDLRNIESFYGIGTTTAPTTATNTQMPTPNPGSQTTGVSNNPVSNTGTSTGSVPPPLNYLFSGIPAGFPINSIQQGIANLQGIYNQYAGAAPGFYNQAQNAVTGAINNAIPQMTDIYGQSLGQQGGITQGAINSIPQFINNAAGQTQGVENQAVQDVQGLQDQYTKNYLQRLGPSGDLGQQLTGEFNNLGISPSSGAFQSALASNLANLGSQNAYQLGQEALMPGIQQQYGLANLSATAPLTAIQEGLQSGLSSSQEQAKQLGQLANVGNLQNVNLASTGALSPLDYLNKSLGQQTSLINQAAQVPGDFWQFQNQAGLAENLASQQSNAQNQAAQYGLLGSLGGGGLAALGAAK